MTPDARHGTYAGHQAHVKEGEDPCTPCRVAQRRYFKAMKYRLATTGPERIELGAQAWRIIDSTGRRELARVTGMSSNYLSKLHAGGPSRSVYRRTRDKILTARKAPTSTGILRRIQALYALGYSAARIARETGACADKVRWMLREDRPHAYHHARIKAGVLDAYTRLAYAPMPTSASATATRNRARERGYVPPMAWDDDTIDNPAATPWRPEKHGTGRRREPHVEEAEFLADQGYGLAYILARLGVSVDALHRAYKRAGRTGDYQRIRDRDAHRRESINKGDAA